MDKTSGVALALNSGVPSYHVDDSLPRRRLCRRREEGRIHLLIHLPIEEDGDNNRWCLGGPITPASIRDRSLRVRWLRTREHILTWKKVRPLWSLIGVVKKSALSSTSARHCRFSPNLTTTRLNSSCSDRSATIVEHKSVKFQQRYQMRHRKSRDDDARWGFNSCNLQFLSAVAPSLTASFALRPGDRSESSYGSVQKNLPC
jgi:hypothetical protein